MLALSVLLLSCCLSSVLYTLRTDRVDARGQSIAGATLRLHTSASPIVLVHRFCYERFDDLGGTSGCARLQEHICARFDCGAPLYTLALKRSGGSGTLELKLWDGEVVADAVRLFARAHPSVVARTSSASAPATGVLNAKELRVWEHLCAHRVVQRSACDCTQRDARVVLFTMVLSNLVPPLPTDAPGTTTTVDLVFDSVAEVAGAAAFAARTCAAYDPSGARCSTRDIAAFVTRRLELVAQERFGVADDFYGWLRLEPSASASQIRGAFRRESLACHPDKVKGKQERFRQLARAYSVLTDASLRRRFDDTLRDARRGGGDVGPILSSHGPDAERIARAMAMLWQMGVRINIPHGTGGINIHIGG
jgi:hypothetical protein